jgi:energy-coupling factor transporter ATP-binding protein EcfA2
VAAALQQTLESFVEIGLGYLSLDRLSGTLSGGEAQRVKMIRHFSSALTDVTYVFDEPTTGLHPHDVQRMNELLRRLRDKGNTVLVVEHEPQTIAVADHVVDLGPGAGRRAAPCASRAPSKGCGPAAPSPAAISTTGPPSRRRCARPPARWRSAARRRTTCATSTSTSRSGCSAWSPMWPAPARAR